jgi:AcrR family transcriptional regulator
VVPCPWTLGVDGWAARALNALCRGCIWRGVRESNHDLHTLLYDYKVKRSKTDAALTRAAILAAALELFQTRGFTTTALDDIAKAARVTRGAVYHHFENKAEIYQALLLESGRKVRELIPAAVAEGGSVLEIVERVFVRQLLAYETDPVLRAEALFALRGDYAVLESVRDLIEVRHAEVLNQLTQTFAEAQAAQEVRPDLAPRDIARAFIAAQTGLVHQSTLPGQRGAIKESASALARIFVAGIRR